jgi:hypothetical protein
MIRQLGRFSASIGIVLLTLGSMPWTASGATIIGTPVALSTLLVPGSSIVSGDKTFTNFSYLPTGDMPGAINVNVVAITDDAGNFGIRFQGAFIDTTGVAGGSDALIDYKVTADSSHRISDAHLQGNPSRLGTLGSISVTETFLPVGPNGENTMRIYDDQNINPPKLVDSTVFATPVQSLSVQKDILALAKVDQSSPTAPQTVTLSFVDQTFSQITVPEPATAVLMFAGVIGFGLLRRRDLA